MFGRGDDTLGKPRRAQISQLELFEIALLLKLYQQFTVERFQVSAFQSMVPCPPLNIKISRVYSIVPCPPQR